MKKIVVFMGTRPEGIKLAPVIRAMQGAPDLAPVLISTGQHREMLQQVTSLFRLHVDEDLAVMAPNQTLAGLTARLVERIDEALDRHRPDLVLVQGDTTTVLAATLTCFYRRIPVGHVEAGLRTGDLSAPFPEEANRRVTGIMTTLHFTPTAQGRDNLLREGVSDTKIAVTGNTVIDAVLMEVARQEEPRVRDQILQETEHSLGCAWWETPCVLVTGHRRENFGGGFECICEALRRLAKDFPGHRFIYPVHLNPNVQKPVYERLAGLANVTLTPPVDYSQLVMILRRCRLVLTDSGGIQEEAPALGKPVLVMRDTTERPEGVTAGTARLVGANTERIVAGVTELLTDTGVYEAMSHAVNPYGDGHASERIMARIRTYFAAGE